MKAMQVNKADQGPVLIPVELQKTEAGLGEILVHVHAAAVTPTELLWYPTTHTKSGTARTRAVPGHEFSGAITEIGKDVQDFEVGDEVYGMIPPVGLSLTQDKLVMTMAEESGSIWVLDNVDR